MAPPPRLQVFSMFTKAGTCQPRGFAVVDRRADLIRAEPPRSLSRSLTEEPLVAMTPALVAVDVRAFVADGFVARPGVHVHGDLVGHGAAGAEQPGLLAELGAMRASRR